MSDDLIEQLEELDKEKANIIHEYYLSKQKQIDDQMKESTKQLKDKTDEERDD